MTIGNKIDRFFGLEIEEYSPDTGIENADKALRVNVDWDEYEKKQSAEIYVQKLLTDPKAGQIKALVIGDWGGAAEGNEIQTTLDLITNNPDKLSSLKALFVGEMTYEESEISWIHQGDYKNVWQAYPALQHLQIRGGSALKLGTIQHAALETLIIETGGLANSIIKSVAEASLNNLNHLELWLGDEYYGWAGDVQVVKPLLSKTLFSKLSYLGLRNSVHANELAALVVNSDVLEQIEYLDLSMGTLSDTGAQHLVSAEAIKSLKKLDLHYHYMSDEMCQKIKNLGIEVDVSHQNSGDEDDRYVSVSE